MHRWLLLFLLAIVTLGCGPATATKPPVEKTDRAASERRAAVKATPKPELDVTQDSYENMAAAIEALKTAALEGDSTEIIRTEKWLVMQADAAIEPLSEIAIDEQGEAAHRIAACRVLRKLGPKTAPTFTKLLEASSEQLQVNAVKALGMIRPTNETIIRQLDELIDAPQQRIRREAMLALENIGEPAEKICTDRLVAILNDAEEVQIIRDAAKRALLKVNPRHSFVD